MVTGKSPLLLSKADKLFKDAMITSATSGTTEVAEGLLTYFVDIGNRECFASMLYLCFDLLRPDVVEELSWQHGLNDFYMPYRIQAQRITREKVGSSVPALWEISNSQPSLLLWRKKCASGPRKIRRRSKRRRRLRSSTPAVYWAIG